LATVLAVPQEQQQTLQAAWNAYQQLHDRFPNHSLRPYAVFERSKVMAAQKNPNGAINELNRFRGEPQLRDSFIAPMALLHRATLMRSQNRAAEAVNELAYCRQTYEATLEKDPARAGWVPLLRYHHAVALREAGKRAEARALFDQVVKTAPDRPEAAEAILRSGQCLKDDAEVKVKDARTKLANGNLNSQQRADAQKQLDDGLKETRDAATFLAAQANDLKTKQPTNEVRARLLYEAAWAHRTIADVEVETVRNKLRDELWRRQRDEAVKRTPPGRQPPFVPAPDVPLSAVPLQQGEKDVRGFYTLLINDFPDITINADARFELAELLSERAEHDAAIKLLRDALDKEPPPELTEKVRLRLGAALLAKGDAKAAQGQFQAVANNVKGPHYAQALYRLGECQLTQDKPEDAIRSLQPFRDNPQLQNVPGVSDRAMLRLGHAFSQAKQWEPSRQAFEILCQRFPNSRWVADARYGMGWALQHANRLDEAVTQYQMVTNLTTTELAAQAQIGIGQVRLAQNRPADAANSFLVVPFAYDYPHWNALALLEAARAFAVNKQNDQAIRLLERLIKEYPDSEEADAAKKRLAELKKG
jgi:TolA-binding protein